LISAPGFAMVDVLDEEFILRFTASCLSRRALTILLGCWLSLPCPAAAVATPLPRVRAVSPVRGARWVLPETNVIVRLDRAPAGSIRDLESAFVVTGSVTGRHPGLVILSEDGRTVVFRPATPFAHGETVSVELGRSISTFSIVSARPPSLATLAADLSADLVPRGAPSRGFHSGTGSDLPADFPSITTAVYQNPSPGYLYLSNVSFGPPTTPYLLILDDSGTPAFSRRMPGPCFDFKMQPNGQLTYIDRDAAKVYVMDSTYTVIDSFACGNGYVTDLHESRLLANGHMLLMSYDPEKVDMSAVVPGGNPDATVIGLVLQEVDDQGNVFFQWRSWDHFEITDAVHEDLTAASVDYVHGNAIEVDADGNLLLSSRHLSEITKIDRETGDLIWRWGGQHNQFTFVGDTMRFSYQHAIRRLANGHYILWDNGNFHEPRVSRAMEYRLDPVARTATVTWEHVEGDLYGFAMGYVQRLPNGNTLISSGAAKPDVFEVAPDGSKVMDLTMPDGIFTYRAYRGPLPTQVGSSPRPAVAQLLSRPVPNPVRDRGSVTLTLPNDARVSLVICDVAGREVQRVLDGAQVSAGAHLVPFDLKDRRAGLYFLRATVGNRSETRKVMLVP
jgi:Arylsulfotransferase (ASST)